MTLPIYPVQLKENQEVNTAASTAAPDSLAIASAAVLVVKTQNDAALLETTVASAAPSASNGIFPPDDDDDQPLPDWFNPNVPATYCDPMEYPGSDILSKLYLMIDWMHNLP